MSLYQCHTGLNITGDKLQLVEIEYKDGYEEITVLKNEVGYGIAKLDTGSEEASSLRNQLYSLQENKQGIIRINGTEYKPRVEIY